MPGACAQTTSPLSASTTSRPLARAASARQQRPHLVAGRARLGAAGKQEERPRRRAASRDRGSSHRPFQHELRGRVAAGPAARPGIIRVPHGQSRRHRVQAPPQSRAAAKSPRRRLWSSAAAASPAASTRSAPCARSTCSRSTAPSTTSTSTSAPAPAPSSPAMLANGVTPDEMMQVLNAAGPLRARGPRPRPGAEAQLPRLPLRRRRRCRCARSSWCARWRGSASSRRSTSASASPRRCRPASTRAPGSPTTSRRRWPKAAASTTSACSTASST